ncbi:MAG: hypothetical protein U0996_21815, partial [Planctomycetaceae bacterium]
MTMLPLQFHVIHGSSLPVVARIVLRLKHSSIRAMLWIPACAGMTITPSIHRHFAVRRPGRQYKQSGE